MGTGMGVTSSSALGTFRPEAIISLWGKKQGWQAGAEQAVLAEQEGCSAG